MDIQPGICQIMMSKLNLLEFTSNLIRRKCMRIKTIRVCELDFIWPVRESTCWNHIRELHRSRNQMTHAELATFEEIASYYLQNEYNLYMELKKCPAKVNDISLDIILSNINR